MEPFKSGIFFLIVTLFICMGCSVDNRREQEAAVERVIRELIDADNRGDLSAVLESYSNDICFYPSGKKIRCGYENIKIGYQKLFLESTLQIRTKISSIAIAGDTAIVTGTNRGIRFSKKNSVEDAIHDEYIALLVFNANRDWRIERLIWWPAE